MRGGAALTFGYVMTGFKVEDGDGVVAPRNATFRFEYSPVVFDPHRLLEGGGNALFFLFRHSWFLHAMLWMLRGVGRFFYALE